MLCSRRGKHRTDKGEGVGRVVEENINGNIRVCEMLGISRRGGKDVSCEGRQETVLGV